MNDGRRRRKAKQARREARRQDTRDPQGTWEAEVLEETPLLDEVREALTGHPLELLGVVSVIVEATTPDSMPWLPSRDERETVELDRLLDGFVDVPNTETTALLAVLAELLDDVGQRARCRQELDARRDTLPRWLTGLGGVEVYRAVRWPTRRGPVTRC
ncbi:hypothetical protein ACTWP6_08745 [Mycobacterium sp. 4D054]|uniref:hypothetical protein n=1 Tax=unclassified Mycobacterium TaxID=2642494 RepID=UPI0021B421A0|nr:hypothetical protein [Mycobacterium sp. SMC-8]